MQRFEDPSSIRSKRTTDSTLKTIRNTVNRFARALPIISRKNAPRLPRIYLDPRNTSTIPTAWFICPDFNRPSGGIRKLYRFVDILNDGGLNASILHGKRGFSCSWFSHRTIINSHDTVAIKPNDLLVVPEIYGSEIRRLPPNIRQIIINQNAYLTLQSLSENPANASPYIDNPDLAAVIVVSDDNADVLSYLFPSAPIKRLRLGIDPSVYFPPAVPKLRRIVYMPRKRPSEASRVLGMLRRRGSLEGWEVSAIGGLSEAQAAELLRSAKIFLSFSSLEGFGLPPLEAMACGCIVIGYHGFGGREYFRSPYATPIEDGDTVSFARAVEKCIRELESGRNIWPSFPGNSTQDLTDTYSSAAERISVMEVFRPLLKP